MPDAMTTLLANVGLSDLERRLRDEAVDEAAVDHAASHLRRALR